ncbi:O-antigen ligase family protein [Bradyrhizobium sp. CIAT3101]|uniref:O-antigen ligase family protein n=1 Tax=Bradyrhizobium sp. CIAT3101 TaxID=439387 RepID=UPI0024B07D2A|nr:O-antigen ligase family protein [Bradyrhizobium sp. CIAT3101]WFU84474.1 O-antigen ligase family protein [Bradyrhizobium sp. CIAT3101]
MLKGDHACEWEFAGNNRMRGRDQASRLEMYFATALLVFSSGVVYVAFLPDPAGETFVAAGESVVYGALWAAGYLVLALFIGLHFRGVLTVFTTHWPMLVLLFAHLLPELIESHSWPRLVLLFATVTFCAWMASRFSPRQMIVTLTYVLPIVIIIHSLSPIVNTTYEADLAERETLIGSIAYAGLFSHKQQAAMTFSISFIFYTLLIFASRVSWQWNLLGAATSLLFLLLSGSANGIVVTLVTLDVSLCLWALIRNRTYLFYVSAFTSIVMATLLYVQSDLLFGALDRSSDLTGRTTLWEQWPGFFYDRLLTGYGYSGFFVEDGPAERLWALDDYFRAPNFHNSFLDVGIAAGAPGLLSLLLILLFGLIGTCSAACRSRRSFVVIFFALFLAACLFGIGDGSLLVHNNFVTICFVTIYFKFGIKLRARITPEFAIPLRREDAWPLPRAAE